MISSHFEILENAIREKQKKEAEIIAEKTQHKKRLLMFLFTSNINSIYRKNEDYYPKVFLKYPDDFDEEKISKLINSNPKILENSTGEKLKKEAKI